MYILLYFRDLQILKTGWEYLYPSLTFLTSIKASIIDKLKFEIFSAPGFLAFAENTGFTEKTNQKLTMNPLNMFVFTMIADNKV